MVLVEIDDSDYKVAVERAKADYMNSLAGSEAAKFNVPISQVGSSSQILSAKADVINAEAGISGATKQVEEAEARLVQAQANAKTANDDLARYATLVGKKEISQQQYRSGPGRRRLCQCHRRRTPGQCSLGAGSREAGQGASRPVHGCAF